MKHLRLFESFREEDIRNICKNYGINNYNINEDGSIDVDGNVKLDNFHLTKLPLKFRNVTDFFDCSDNKLTSLEGCPKSIIGYFFCHNNQLTSLEGGPKSVGGGFYCSNNKLTSLEGCPESIGDRFYCDNNELTSFKGCPEYIGGDFNCRNNKIVTFEHLPFSIGSEFHCDYNPIFEVWKLFGDYSKIEFLNDCDAIREPDNNSEEPIIILDRLNYFLEEIGKPTVTKVYGYKCI